MGDAGAMERGFAALERAGPLEKEGKTKEAITFYKESIECFTVALRKPSLSVAARREAQATVKFFKERVRELEGELAKSYFEDLLPEAPSTKPVVSAKGARARSSGPPRGIKVEQEEERGRQSLNRAILLEKEGEKNGWRDATAKKRAADEYAEAAEAFMSATNLSRRAPGGRKEVGDRNEERAMAAITKAEILTGVAKAASPAPVTPTQPRRKPAPPRSPARPSQGELTPEEVGVLKDSSYVNGKLFMPWIADDLQENFDFPKPWKDPDGLLPLSEPQTAKLEGWKRPSEVMPGEPRMITNVNPYSIKQDLITDCSFVASLCIASAFERRFHKQLITGIIYPQDNRRMPVYNPAGKYLVKLTVNGVARKVVVDDRLPTGNNGRLLCSASADKTELWVSIIEKAYLKVNGGYDFPGSNSGIDLFALTGWLPEQIFFEEHREANGGSAAKPDQPLDNYEKSERVWQRLLSAHEFGDCLITVATSDIEKEEADKLGLVPSHAYAVLDAKEVNGTRLLQVKNPWSRKRWTGPYSVEDTLRWTPALKEAVKYDLATAQLKDNGVFWIDFASIVQYFRNVFMNWNPALFSHRFVTHARWPVDSGPPNDNYNVGDNPQLSLIVQSGATAAAAGGAMSSSTSKNSPMVWVLLSRHVTTLEVDSSSGDFLTVHVYGDTEGKRIYYPGNPMFRGLYTNNPHTLVRFDLPETATRKDIAYTLVISQYEKKREVRYTVNVYCTSTFRLFETPVAPEHRRKFPGTWDAGSAGGGMGRPGYYTNPQYVFVLTHPKTKVHLELKAPRDYKVNITVVSEGGMRVSTVSTEREVMSSGSYRPGFCYADEVLPAGTYTMVISTYKPGKIGGFFLELSTSSAIRPPMRIPAEGEGMTKQVLLGRWREDDGSAAGCGNFGRYHDNPRYVISPISRTTIVLRVAVAESAGASPAVRPAVNVTLFLATPEVGDASVMSPEAGHAQGKKLTLDSRCRPTSSTALASSNKGTYLDSGGGSATELVQVEPGDYIAVVSAFSPQEADFVFTVYSTPAVAQVYRMG